MKHEATAKGVEMTVLDLKSDDEWDAFLRQVAQDFGMAVLLTDEKGAVLRSHGERFPLCAAVRGHDEAMTFICSQSNTVMLQVARKTMRPVVDLCEAGLFRVVLPIIRDGALIGQIATCGLAPEDEEFEPFLVAQMLGINEEEVTDLFEHTPTVSEEKIEALAADYHRRLAQ